MSNGNGSPKPKDLWDKLEVIGKLVAVVVVSAGVAYYGIWSENRRFAEAERNRAAQAVEAARSRSAQATQSEANRRVQAAIQLLSGREAVAADMRTKMFGALIPHYFQRHDPRSRIVVIELMALNFEGMFQVRPLFDDVDAVLRRGSPEKRELRRVARNVADRQVEKVVSSGGTVCEARLVPGTPRLADCAPLMLTLLRVAEDRIIVSSNPEDRKGFEVTYFDAPFADNSKRGELRYSLVLVGTDGQTAIVRIVVFPRHYFSVEDRLGHDQLIGRHLLQDFTGREGEVR